MRLGSEFLTSCLGPIPNIVSSSQTSFKPFPQSAFQPTCLTQILLSRRPQSTRLLDMGYWKPVGIQSDPPCLPDALIKGTGSCWMDRTVLLCSAWHKARPLPQQHHKTLINAHPENLNHGQTGTRQHPRASRDQLRWRISQQQQMIQPRNQHHTQSTASHCIHTECGIICVWGPIPKARNGVR